MARVKHVGEAALLARDLHILPEFLGNRSPYADPDSRAVIAGLDLDADIGALERLFVAGLCGLAYGLADVIDAFAENDVSSRMVVMAGGASRSPLVRQIMADTTGLTVALPRTQEPVLLGAAMLGAVASGGFRSLAETMASMSALGRVSDPTDPDVAGFHQRKRRIHKMLRALDRDSRAIMRDEQSGGARHDPELRRRADRFRAGENSARARCADAGGRRLLPQRRGRACPIGRADRLRRRRSRPTCGAA